MGLTLFDGTFGAYNIDLILFDGNFGAKNIGLTLLRCHERTKKGVREVITSTEQNFSPLPFFHRQTPISFNNGDGKYAGVRTCEFFSRVRVRVRFSESTSPRVRV